MSKVDNSGGNVNKAIEKLNEAFKTYFEKVKTEAKTISFLDCLGVDTPEEAIELFNFDKYDSQWQKLFEKDIKSFDDLIAVRRKILFLASARKALFNHYLAGSDYHVKTDVDILRLSFNAIRERTHFSDPIQNEFGDEKK